MRSRSASTSSGLRLNSSSMALSRSTSDTFSDDSWTAAEGGAVGAAMAGLWWNRTRKSAAAATATQVVVLRIGEAMEAKVGRREGLGFWEEDDEEEALMAKDLKGGGEVVLRVEKGLGKDGRWGLRERERWRGW
ncbi:hypothetical protein PanWU01x14_062980 [Parasponia andersonii]|uniref:Uncharacterized protein n=1 Tax=Parasponia andersonii TaxID=3476 RepID=A0A2P5DHN4_PARAD|nr:hypothetical protein PanWU01x14_062980 [Parasponia andersonii]